MPGSTLKSAAHKIGYGSHIFRFSEIVHAFWHRNICPTFSRLRFRFSINFTLVGTLMNNHWIHCEEIEILALIESSFICLGSCHFLCSRITSTGSSWMHHFSSLIFKHIFTGKRYFQGSSQDSDSARLADPRGFSHCTGPQYKAHLLSSIWVDARFIFRGKFLAWILHFNAMH